MDAPVNPEMMVLARESRGLTQSAVAGLLGVTQGHWSKVEAGLLPPTEPQTARLSRLLDYPIAFFESNDPVYGPSVSEFFHRKRKTAPTKTVAMIHARLNIRRMHAARLLRAAEIPSLNIPRVDPDEYSGAADEIARVVRATWQLPRGPIKNITTLIETAGGVVVPMSFGTSMVDAMSQWVPGLPPMFFVNQDTPVDKQRLSLAHELGHLVMHALPRDRMEEEAMEFAGEFLLPGAEIRPRLVKVTLPQLAALKPHWRVSMAALLHRANELGAISERTYRFRWTQMGKAGYRTRKPPEVDLSPEPASVLVDLIRLHTTSLGVFPRRTRAIPDALDR